MSFSRRTARLYLTRWANDDWRTKAFFAVSDGPWGNAVGLELRHDDSAHHRNDKVSSLANVAAELSPGLSECRAARRHRPASRKKGKQENFRLQRERRLPPWV